MKGYPKHINCKQDFINLLSEPEHQAQALADLIVIRDMDDDKALRTVSIDETTGEAVTEEIDNPMPLWKVKGFSSRQDVTDLIAEVENE
ncbi:MAG: hypothetical protein ABFD76_05265 [Smithella sp.]